MSTLTLQQIDECKVGPLGEAAVGNTVAKMSTLTLQQIDECKVGPLGEAAVGKTVAKMFDGVEFRGEVDRFRTERKRFVYHVTYSCW
jgi:hypothetical protein